MSEREILERPSKLETYPTGLSGSAWLLFIGIAVIIGGLIHTITTNSIKGLILGWILGGIIGYIGYISIFNSLKIERLKLAAHMLRSLSLHASIASERGNNEALALIEDAERKWRGFITRAFRAAGTDIETTFVQSSLKGITSSSQTPYILVYRNGILDAPSTLIANATARAGGAIIGLLGFILLGLILLVIGVIMGSIFTYTTARTLKEHAQLENKIRRTLGLPESPTSAPGAGGLLASIITAGLYLPIYAKQLSTSITNHVTTH